MRTGRGGKLKEWTDCVQSDGLGLESDGVKGLGLGWGGHGLGGWAKVHGRVEENRGRCGQTSSGEERGNETGKVVIAHGSVEFCEATPIGLAEES